MKKQRKLELVKEFTEVLNEVKQEWVKEVVADGEKPTFEDFRVNVITGIGIYLDGCVEFTEAEKADFNRDYTVSGDLRIILEIVLGQIWLEW